MASPSTGVKCPKCARPIPFADPDEPDPVALSKMDHGCPYVSCDQLDCRALDDPRTLAQWRAAAEHWRGHAYQHGCSHGN